MQQRVRWQVVAASVIVLVAIGSAWAYSDAGPFAIRSGAVAVDYSDAGVRLYAFRGEGEVELSSNLLVLDLDDLRQIRGGGDLDVDLRPFDTGRRTYRAEGNVRIDPEGESAFDIPVRARVAVRQTPGGKTIVRGRVLGWDEDDEVAVGLILRGRSDRR